MALPVKEVRPRFAVDCSLALPNHSFGGEAWLFALSGC
jgi:hypothetical protein